MGKTIVSLVSDQTIPNVMFIKAIGDAERLVFITTKGMENNGRTYWILKSVGVKSSNKIIPHEIIIVSEQSISEIKAELSKHSFFEGNGEIIVNLTGGNKIMFLAAYEFFKEKSSQSQNIINMYYLPIGKDKFDKVFPSEENNCIDTYLCNLKEYLTAYSIEQGKGGKNPLVKFEETKEFYIETFNSEKGKNIIKNLRKKWEDIKEDIKKKKLPNRDEYNKSLNGLLGDEDIKGLIKKAFGTFDINEPRLKYLAAGGWFEEYVYFLIQRGLKLKDEQICLNFEMEDKSHYHKTPPNEIDVIFIYKNKINIIECKTGLKNQSNNDILQQVLYKQSALKKGFGLTAKSFLFLPYGLSGNKNNKERAVIYGIDIVDDQKMLLDEDRFKSEFLEKNKLV